MKLQPKIIQFSTGKKSGYSHPLLGEFEKIVKRLDYLFKNLGGAKEYFASLDQNTHCQAVLSILENGNREFSFMSEYKGKIVGDIEIVTDEQNKILDCDLNTSNTKYRFYKGASDNNRQHMSRIYHDVKSTVEHMQGKPYGNYESLL